MKKILTVILSLSLAAGLAGCGEDNKIPDPSEIDMDAAAAAAAAENDADEPEEESSEEMPVETSVETESETVTSAAETEAAEISWQDEYTQYISELDYYYGFYIGDINGDEIPEAVIAINPYEMTTILYIGEYGLSVMDLETQSVWGSVRYIDQTKQILFKPIYGHTQGTFGYEGYYIYDWNGSDYELSYMLTRDAGIYYESDGEVIEEYGQGYINGEEVDFDTFEEKLKEIQKLEEENSYFPIKTVLDDDLESYMQEFLPDLKLIEGMEENFKYYEEDNDAAL